MLKTFLMSRLPIASFCTSNGHGRAQTGRMPTGRQGNLIVTSTKTVPDAELRKQLIEEAKKQGKPYGLYFEDISSGFAVTSAARRRPSRSFRWSCGASMSMAAPTSWCAASASSARRSPR